MEKCTDSNEIRDKQGEMCVWAYVYVCVIYEYGSGVIGYYASIPTKSNHDTWYFKCCLSGQNDP